MFGTCSTPGCTCPAHGGTGGKPDRYYRATHKLSAMGLTGPLNFVSHLTPNVQGTRTFERQQFGMCIQARTSLGSSHLQTGELGDGEFGVPTISPPRSGEDPERDPIVPLKFPGPVLKISRVAVEGYKRYKSGKYSWERSVSRKGPRRHCPLSGTSVLRFNQAANV